MAQSESEDASTERDKTDKSLDVERKKTDDEISKRQEALEGEGSAVQKSRDRADNLVEKSRDQADAALREAGALSEQWPSLEQQRSREDAALSRQRSADDKAIDIDLEERARALKSLLRFERQQTDERLSSERARADAALATRDDFMNMVNHDLRNMLGGIAVAAALQIRSAPDDESGRRTRQAAERIQRFVARMDRLVGDLIDIASIEAGRLALTLRDDNAGELLREASEALQHAAAAKRITVSSEVSGTPLEVTCDHQRVLQVLGNLLSNAIKFSPEGSHIALGVERVDAQVQFSVEDTGSGIPADYLESIFERFWQLTTGDRRGLGLGLFIAKSIVEAHGGRIWARSEPQRGSIFYFTLPLATVTH